MCSSDLEREDVVAERCGSHSTGQDDVVRVQESPGQQVRRCDRQTEGQDWPEHGAVETQARHDTGEGELQDGRHRLGATSKGVSTTQ